MASPDPVEIGNENTVAMTRRRLILRDTLTFLSLTSITLVLFLVTLVLFRSFESHREELGRRWSDRGRASLNQGRPEQAIESFRTALAYAPSQRSYQLLLAQALAEAGHSEEAFNYFATLWDSEPGSGIINLQLARLAAARNKPKDAANFYRASIYGTWEGDGAVRRRAVRMEFVRYLLQQGDTSAARAELLVVEGNADTDASLDLEIGNLFHRAGDIAEALEAYQKAGDSDPKDPAPFAAAGRLAYSVGRIATAQRLLQRAVRAAESAGKRDDPASRDLPELLRQSDRILQIFPSPQLSSNERAARLLALRALAQKRVEACTTAQHGLSPQLQQINARWSSSLKNDTRAALMQDSTLQDEFLQLIFETEVAADQSCGPASGDDALLVQVSRFPKAVDQ